MGCWERVSLSVVVTVFSLLTSSLAKEKPGIAVYWGQKVSDGSLEDTCNSGHYKIVLLSYLNNFGCKKSPVLDLDGHCTSGKGSDACAFLQPQIERCKEKGVKVLLAIGGPSESYSLCSGHDAKEFAEYLDSNFLSGKDGPLGEVTLDGIHFDIQSGSGYYWDDLVEFLHDRKGKDKKFYLSAAPRCFIPDFYLKKAIETSLFDYVLVQFYDRKECQYSDGDTTGLLNKWKNWVDHLKDDKDTTLFLGLTADKKQKGYISPMKVRDDVLPYINRGPSYGGISVLDRANDGATQFSKIVEPSVIPTNARVSPYLEQI